MSWPTLKHPRRAKYWLLAWMSCWLLLTLAPAHATAHATSIAAARIQTPAAQPAVPPTVPTPDLVTQGKQLYDAGRLEEAIALWQNAANQFAQQHQPEQQAQVLRYLAIAHQDLGQFSAAQKALTQAQTLAPTAFLFQAQLLGTQASLYQAQGQFETAHSTYQEAEKRYASQGDRLGVSLSQLNQSQVLQSLGFYSRAQTLLLKLRQDLTQEIEASPQDLSVQRQSIQAQTSRQLGAIAQSLGNLTEAETHLQESLKQFGQLGAVAELAPTLLLLGDLELARENSAGAIATYQQAQTFAVNPQVQLDAQLKQLRLLALQKGTPSPTLQTLLQSIPPLLKTLPPTHGGIYAQVNFAESLRLRGQTQEAIAHLTPVLRQAQTLGDQRAESYVLGQLGSLYETQGHWTEALQLTRQAYQQATAIQAEEIAVSWLWQEGRILKAQGKLSEAIAPYRAAVKLLQTLRQDLVAMAPDVQFSFRDQVEPIYRQLAQILLTEVDRLPSSEQQGRLEESRQTIEALQLAELQNFFREACETYEAQSIDQIDPEAAVIYSIVVGDRLEVILSAPHQPLQHYGTALTADAATELAAQVRQSLNPAFLPEEGLPAAQKLYDALIRPAQPTLQTQSIKTLVFVLDDFLRTIPMAVLHDGDRYLIETYQIALTPGLQLFESTPISSTQNSLLVGGLTEARQGFSALPGVSQEVEAIAQNPHTKVLLNQDFIQTNLAQTVQKKPFSIIHLATHGQFSSRAQDTFLLTWQERLGVQDLENWLDLQLTALQTGQQTSVELLVLSACQTAKGDARAGLGLAGMVVRSGARSAIATLWAVQDQSTADLMAVFYHNLLQAGMDRGEALRQAQLSLMKGSYAHPYYWAPFVLVGNWQ